MRYRVYRLVEEPEKGEPPSGLSGILFLSIIVSLVSFIAETEEWCRLHFARCDGRQVGWRVGNGYLLFTGGWI